MSVPVLDGLTLLAAFGSGLVAGLFFAFSICVMRALGRLPPAQGVAAMQSINLAIINPWFLSVFFGTALACVPVLIAALSGETSAGDAYRASGSLLYLVGSILVTVVYNVPLNNGLARAAPESAEARSLWAAYLRTWTRWNHVRTAASLAAAALLFINVETPRLCRGGSRSLTFPGVHRGDSTREPPSTRRGVPRWTSMKV